MYAWRDFRDCVAQVITTMDCIEQCRLGSLLDCMGQKREENWGVLEKMERAGLLVIDQPRAGGAGGPSIVAITTKGRLLAQDIRKVTGKAVEA